MLYNLQALPPLTILAASLWLLAREGMFSALVFFLFGLIIAGAYGFALQLGAALAGLIDRFLLHFCAFVPQDLTQARPASGYPIVRLGQHA